MNLRIRCRVTSAVMLAIVIAWAYAGTALAKGRPGNPREEDDTTSYDSGHVWIARCNPDKSVICGSE